MKRTLCICMLTLLISGCETFFGPIPGLHYRSELPPRQQQSDAVDLLMVREFARQLANLADLQVVGHTELTGNRRMDEGKSVELKPNADKKILVRITIHSSRKMFFVQLHGNTESSTADRIVSTAKELFAREYNGAQLVPYTPYRGLFGP